VLAYDVTKRKCRSESLEQFAAAGREGGRRRVSRAIDIVGDDLDELSTEIEKLSTWRPADNGVACGAKTSEQNGGPGRGRTPDLLADGRRGGDATSARLLRSAEEIMERSHRPAGSGRRSICGIIRVARQPRRLCAVAASTRPPDEGMLPSARRTHRG